MSTKTRIYVVSSPHDVRLVRAPHAAHAVRHVARDLIDARVAGQDELVILVGRGVKVETCGDEAPCDEVTA